MRVLPILMLLFALVLLGGCRQTVYTDLGEREVNEMLAVLQGGGIKASKTLAGNGQYKLRVPDGELAMAVSLLRERGYPDQNFKSMGDLFKGDGLLASPQEEWARYVYALSESLSETVSQIDGVVTARVHLVLPNNDPRASEGAPSAASVFIEYNPRVELEAAKADIKRIVEKSVEGLEYAKISVVMLPTQPLLRKADRPSMGGNSEQPVYASIWSGAFGIVTLLACAGWFVWRRRHDSMGIARGRWRDSGAESRTTDAEVLDGGRRS